MPNRPYRVALNGYGRIGRCVLRALYERVCELDLEGVVAKQARKGTAITVPAIRAGPASALVRIALRVVVRPAAERTPGSC